MQMLIAGEYACFTRPELSVECVSYDLPTPSACIGIFEAVYRKPEMRWHIKRIHVLKPIRFASVQRAEVNQVASPWRTQINVRNARMLRHATVLRDVAYLVEAHIEALDSRSTSVILAARGSAAQMKTQTAC